MASTTITGNVQSLGGATLTLSPHAVAANTTAEQTFTLQGIRPGDVLLDVNSAAPQAGLGIVGRRVSAVNTIGITFANNTAGSITPTAGTSYAIAWLRPDAVTAAVAA